MGPEYKFASQGFKSRASPNKVTNCGFGVSVYGNPYSVRSRQVHIVLDFSFLSFLLLLFFIFFVS